MKLFRLEDYEIKINKEEALLIPEFKALFELKYNKEKGDIDGRKRIRAFKELTYIYFMQDYKSEHANFSNEERHTQSLIDSDLPENYKISKELQAALDKYDLLQQTLSLKALSSVRNTLITSMGMGETLELLMQDKLKDIKEQLEEESTFIDNVKDMSELLSLIEKSGKIASSLPKVISTLEALEDKVKNENQTSTKVRGDQEDGWMG